MYKLYHFPLCPFSRKVRLVLAEKDIKFSLVEEKFWKKRKEFVAANPFGTVPFLVGNGVNVVHSSIICDYIESTYPDPRLFVDDMLDVLEIKRVCAWFDEKFFKEVVEYILYEKVVNFFKSGAEPDFDCVNAARYNIRYHFSYMEFLLQRKRWIACDQISIADLTAAAHISVIDYLNEIKWEAVPSIVKDWYSVVKSRISMRAILADSVPGFIPSKHYANLDF